MMVKTYIISVYSRKKSARIRCFYVQDQMQVENGKRFNMWFEIVRSDFPANKFDSLSLKRLYSGNNRRDFIIKIIKKIIPNAEVKIGVLKGTLPEFISPLDHKRHKSNLVKGSEVINTNSSSNVIPESLTKQNGYITFEVLFGTNRLEKSNPPSVKDFFSGDRGSELTVGACQVSIPKNKKHKTGSIERPNWFEELVFGESPKKHFTILSINKKSEESFIEDVRTRIGESTDKCGLLFIHGFNNSFTDAMYRTAQIGHDLNFKGPVFSFSWPSKGSVKGYIYDMDSSESSGPKLKSFLEVIIGKGGIEKLHIIAHSMGNVALTEALLELKSQSAYPHPAINQIILAAPDIDRKVFLENIYPKICQDKTPPRITLYASANDKALKASAKIRYNEPRVGFADANLLVTEGIDTIDASDVDTNWLGHGYFAETKTLINDLFLVLNGVLPNERILQTQSKIVNGKSLPYWVLRR